MVNGPGSTCGRAVRGEILELDLIPSVLCDSGRDGMRFRYGDGLGLSMLALWMRFLPAVRFMLAVSVERMVYDDRAPSFTADE